MSLIVWLAFIKHLNIYLIIYLVIHLVIYPVIYLSNWNQALFRHIQLSIYLTETRDTNHHKFYSLAIDTVLVTDKEPNACSITMGWAVDHSLLPTPMSISGILCNTIRAFNTKILISSRNFPTHYWLNAFVLSSTLLDDISNINAMCPIFRFIHRCFQLDNNVSERWEGRQIRCTGAKLIYIF